MQTAFPGIYKDVDEKINIAETKAIMQGWSDDKKYCITAKAGIKYLIRISAAEYAERKRCFYELARQAAMLDIPMNKPVLFGVREEGCYSLYTWIDGENAKDMIDKLSEEEQYRYGVKAGEILKKIHTIPAPDGLECWENRFNRKMDSKVEMYQKCELKYDEDQCILDYIRENRMLLKNRPQCYQHGDYHIGNMMMGKDKQLYIIDFDRDDYGDPWEEFNRIVWSVQKSPLFASGLIDGYFDYNIPMEFWRLLALYIASNTLSSLPWAIRFGQEQIDVMHQQQKEVLRWYQHMRNPVPTWYVAGRNKCLHKSAVAEK